MFLFLTTLDEENQTRAFTCWLTKLETICNFLSYLSLTGVQILKANLIDNGHRTKLLPNAFAGSSVSTAIQQLKPEWKQILSEPVN